MHSDTKNQEEIRESAQKLQKEGNYREAINKYLAALEHEPESEFILSQLALLSYDIEDAVNTIKYSDALIEKGCATHLIWFVKGASLLKLNNIDDAVNCLEAALKLSPDFYPARVDLTSALLKHANNINQVRKVCESSLLGFHDHIEKNRFIKINNGKIEVAVFKLKHDLEQSIYLEENNIDSATSKVIYKQISGILGNKSRTNVDAVFLSEKEYLNLKSYYKEAPILEPFSSGYYLNPNLDWAGIENSYLHETNEITYIDDFLSPEALSWLIKFSLVSKAWLREYKSCYLGAFANNGFMSEVHLNIARELRIKLPKIIGNLSLEQMWGFKYYSQIGRGINVHADFAKVNLNFWITPDKYNLDTNSGGMKIYSHPAPSNWNPIDYNANVDFIYEYLKTNNSDCITVPYKQNRAVLFNSALFHETDKIDFTDEYQGRRINITYLFGNQLIF
jgi:tetratricopeptide (TPR) repeat protein